MKLGVAAKSKPILIKNLQVGHGLDSGLVQIGLYPIHSEFATVVNLPEKLMTGWDSTDAWTNWNKNNMNSKNPPFIAQTK